MFYWHGDLPNDKGWFIIGLEKQRLLGEITHTIFGLTAKSYFHFSTAAENQCKLNLPDTVLVFHSNSFLEK